MQSPNREYLVEADQLRGIAAILVFFFHSMHSARNALGGIGWPVAGDPFSALMWEGHMGVSLFFVLSGFILTTGTIGRQIHYWQFMRNRALRIMPLMILVVMFSVFGSQDIDFGQIASSFLFFKNTSAAFSDPAQLAGTVWTVAAEFQLYFVAPFLIAFTAGRGIVRFIFPVICVFWILRMILLSGVLDQPAEMFRISYYTAAGRANQFLIGIALAYTLKQVGPLSGRVTWFLLIGSTLGIFGVAWGLNASGGSPAWSLERIFLPEFEAVVWATFLAGYLAAKPLGSGRVASLAKLVGLLSFSIYLLHYSIQRQFWSIVHPRYLIEWIDSPIAATVANLILLAVVLVLSTMTWKCVEQPFLALRQRYVSD